MVYTHSTEALMVVLKPSSGPSARTEKQGHPGTLLKKCWAWIRWSAHGARHLHRITWIKSRTYWWIGCEQCNEGTETWSDE